MDANPRPYLYPDYEFLGGAEGFVAAIHSALNHDLPYEEFRPEEVELLCRHLQVFRAPASSVLLAEGEEGDHLILLLTGEVIVRKADLSGKVHSLALVGPGSILGEMSLIDGEKRFASCVAASEVRFAVLTRHDLDLLLATQPRLANKFLLLLLQMMIGRLRTMGLRAISGLDRPLV